MKDMIALPTRRGPKLWCPNCKSVEICHADKPERFGLPRERRYEGEDYEDIQWFRRVRVCNACPRHFVTGELSEELIIELIELRRRSASMLRPKVDGILRKQRWLARKESIPVDLAQGLVRCSAWWLTHSSGNPVRAPRHANRIYLSQRHGWAVDFGANTFLPGKALERSRDRIREFLDRIKKGDIPKRSEVERSLMRAIAGSVANYVGDEYDQYSDGRDLVFGAQSIDVSDAVRFVLDVSGISNFLAPD